MFQYDISSVKHYSSKFEKESAYYQFLQDIHEEKAKYPFSLECENTYKGLPVKFTVTSWGGYFNADNVWTVFIAYRSNNPKHTTQHQWSWDEANQCCFDHRVLEFIN